MHFPNVDCTVQLHAVCRSTNSSWVNSLQFWHIWSYLVEICLDYIFSAIIKKLFYNLSNKNEINLGDTITVPVSVTFYFPFGIHQFKCKSYHMINLLELVGVSSGVKSYGGVGADTHWLAEGLVLLTVHVTHVYTGHVLEHLQIRHWTVYMALFMKLSPQLFPAEFHKDNPVHRDLYNFTQITVIVIANMRRNVTFHYSNFM